MISRLAYKSLGKKKLKESQQQNVNDEHKSSKERRNLF
jgi:hypothetical protein